MFTVKSKNFQTCRTPPYEILSHGQKHRKQHLKGIDPDLIGAHSLRAGGTIALKITSEDDTTIMKMDRWHSLTFTEYTHTQISHLSKDVSAKMSMPLPFLVLLPLSSSLTHSICVVCFCIAGPVYCVSLYFKSRQA